MKVYRETKNGMTTIGVKTWWGAKRIIYQYAIYNCGISIGMVCSANKPKRKKK